MSNTDFLNMYAGDRKRFGSIGGISIKDPDRPFRTMLLKNIKFVDFEVLKLQMGRSGFSDKID